ncbi:LuxR C-terminal-related transcriptional regulator [Streptomyces sp. NPDC001922]|uniref:helix-turn-helix transcriptional regulator n=1 Tax=Streptomyces sp. NPDC001922 TaxID=3364624 RepID=UPI0036C505BD
MILEPAPSHEESSLHTLARLLEQQEKALETASVHARYLQEQIAALSLYSSGADPGVSGVEDVTDPERARALLNSVAVLARRQILVIQPSVLARQLIADWMSRDGCCGREAGVTIRTIHQSSALHSARTTAYLEKLSCLGVRVRVAPLLPFRLIVVDEALALVCPPGKLLLVRHPALVRLLGRVFEFCWDGARDIARPAPAPDATAGTVACRGPADRSPRLTEQQLVILKLWARGRQDAAIARELRVSPRTLRRMVSALLRRLGVSSRFEAGVVAARTCGLLDSPDPPADGAEEGPGEPVQAGTPGEA